MSTHPNAILMAVFTPDDLARKTYRSILDEPEAKDDNIKLGDENYRVELMEDSYHEDWQISAKEGDIIVFNLMTYGYGERLEWVKVEAQKKRLEEWSRGICERHKCSVEFFVTANYW
jgi:hypothetical protein